MNLTRKHNTLFYLLTLFAIFGLTTAGYAQNMPDDYQAVIAFLGKKGDYKANVLKVTVDGVALPTPFGFGGWLAMTKGKGGNSIHGRRSSARTKTPLLRGMSPCWNRKFPPFSERYAPTGWR